MDEFKVLLVEDEPDIRFLLEATLRQDGAMDVMSFDNGLSAIESIQCSGELFDFALVDFRMPFMTGIELHERLKLLPGLEGLTTALITATVRDEEMEAYKRAGIKGLIAKPFDPMALCSQIRSMYESR